MRWIVLFAVLLLPLIAFDCTSASEDCELNGTCIDYPPEEDGGTGGSGGGAGGTGGTGGTDPCGGCGGATPHCDEVNGICEACLEHEHCTVADAAQCDGGSCVPCTSNPHCAGVTDAGICDAGTCVECNVDDDDACGGGETCDLVDFACVGVAQGSVDSCEACTNDVQCVGGHKCVPLDFPVGTFHGYFCLAALPPACDQPYVGVAGKESISGEAAANYCGVAEDFATCEAVLALQSGWHCTGEGMCSEELGGTQEAVLGAICRDLFAGAATNRCTYRCATDAVCPADGNGRFCGDELGQNPPDFCGGDTS